MFAQSPRLGGARIRAKCDHLGIEHHSSWTAAEQMSSGSQDAKMYTKKGEPVSSFKIYWSHPNICEETSTLVRGVMGYSGCPVICMMLEALPRNLRWQRAISFLHQLESTGLRQNEITYSAAVVSCELATHAAEKMQGAARRVDTASKEFNRYQESGVRSPA